MKSSRNDRSNEPYKYNPKIQAYWDAHEASFKAANKASETGKTGRRSATREFNKSRPALMKAKKYDPEIRMAYRFETVILCFLPVCFLVGLSSSWSAFMILVFSGFCLFMAYINWGSGARCTYFMPSAKRWEELGRRWYLVILPLHVTTYIAFDRFQLFFQGGAALFFVPLFYGAVALCLFNLIKARKARLPFWEYVQVVGDGGNPSLLISLALYYIAMFSGMATIFTAHAVGLS